MRDAPDNSAVRAFHAAAPSTAAPSTAAPSTAAPADQASSAAEPRSSSPSSPPSLARRLLSATARDRLHNALIDAPVAGEAYVRLRSQLRHGVVTPSTELILEGYPRSANAYAEWAFRYANGEDVRMAVRLHSPRAVRFGVEHGIPTMVLIRAPRDAVASWLQYKPGLEAERAFRRYARYYEQVYPMRNDVVIAEFHDVVDDFGAVIKRCNDHFGTSFLPYSREPEAEAWVRRHIESAWAYDETGETPEHRVPRPSSDRQDADDILEGVLDDPRVRKALTAAERIWERLASRSA